MTAYFDVENYKQFLLKMQGGKMYLQVVGQIKAAIDYGVLLGVEEDIVDTGDVLRAHARIKVLNKHIDGWEKLPLDLMVGYYDGYADNPKKGGKGAAATFPVEDALTSAVGRALTLAGFNYQTTATADEMAIVEKKKEGGNGYRNTDEVVTTLRAALKKGGVTTQIQADKASIEKFGVGWKDLTPDQIVKWDTDLAANPLPPF